MLNGIFVFVVLVSILLAAQSGQMQALTDAILKDAGRAVTLAIGLVGVMSFFLGLLRVVERGGLLGMISRAAAPVMRRLFPGVPSDHPAMSAMVLNITSNMLGLANAATPFGIKAMEELDKLNGRKGTATNAMVLFLAINTSGLTLLPTSVIALRATMGSKDPAGIFFPTWFASACATLVGVAAALVLGRLPRYRRSEPPVAADSTGSSEDRLVEGESAALAEERVPPRRGRRLAFVFFWLAWLGLLVYQVRGAVTPEPLGEVVRRILSSWTLPTLVAGLVLFGWVRGVRVYDALVDGAKEGFQVALRIIPYLVAILVAVGMLRASGGIDVLTGILGPVTAWIHMPAEALPMALLRPLSGSGAYGLMAEIMTVHGPDSLLGYLVSTIQGSTETTFYVLAVYFGSVGIKHTRHTLPACVAADIAGVLAAVFIVHQLFS